MCRRETAMSNADRRNTSGAGIRDIGTFVENYERLLDKLYPVFAVWDGVVYIARWENYLLTLCVLMALSFLLYWPAVLLSLSTLAVILMMAVGRYHAQTKTAVALRRVPQVELLDSNQQALKKQHSEQKNMQRLREEYRKILSKAEDHMLTASKFMDYVTSIYLWKSPEVSLCVTVLLCVLLALLCAINLHTIGATLPVVLLCTNKYFLSRTVDVLKWMLLYVVERRRRPTRAAGTGNSSPAEGEKKEKDEEEEEGAVVAVTASSAGTAVFNNARASDGSGDEATEGLGSRSDTRRSTAPELRHRVERTGLQSQASAEPLTNSVAAGGGEGTAGGDRGGATDVGILGGAPQSTRKDGAIEFCCSCKTHFAKLLKPKHDCMHCGQSFCKSCTVKVKRAALGATSPAAFEESVRVCLSCKTELDRWAGSHVAEPNNTSRK